MKRPPGLPDFKKPPLDEVVLGVQFAPAPGYQQILAGSVWALFKDAYPLVEEHPILAPEFETFGPSRQAAPTFQLVSGASHDRFWFLTPSKEELIQFQPDRLIHNWRKVGDGENPYPRFEGMLPKFEKEMLTLQEYFRSLGVDQLSINQCEVTYLNAIRASDGSMPRPRDWFKGLALDDDQYRIGVRRVLTGADGSPRSRLYLDAFSALDAHGRNMARFSLRVRGVPEGDSIQSALDFLISGRDTIVQTFADVTTEQAHAVWERIK